MVSMAGGQEVVDSNPAIPTNNCRKPLYSKGYERTSAFNKFIIGGQKCLNNLLTVHVPK